MEPHEPHLDIKLALTKMVQSWKNVSLSQIHLLRMIGITNETYKAQVVGSQLPAVIYRKFGDSTENIFLDRGAEAFIYQHISDVGLGPKIYGEAQGVRVEQFVESTVLATKDMFKEEYFEKVAFNLRKFHSMRPGNKILKESLFKRVFFSGDALLKKCQQKLNQNIFTEAESQLLPVFRSWVTPSQLAFVEKVTASLQQQPLVFSHNDLLGNNILITPKGQFIFIDYEYAGYNYPIFDIANYLNETEYNYQAKEPPYFRVLQPPKKELIRRFIRCYVLAQDCSSFKELLELAKASSVEDNPLRISEAVELQKQLSLGQMLSNLMWGWWGIIVSKNPDIKFDYLAFSKKRYDDYQRLKQTLL